MKIYQGEEKKKGNLINSYVCTYVTVEFHTDNWEFLHGSRYLLRFCCLCMYLGNNKKYCYVLLSYPNSNKFIKIVHLLTVLPVLKVLSEGMSMTKKFYGVGHSYNCRIFVNGLKIQKQ